MWFRTRVVLYLGRQLRWSSYYAACDSSFVCVIAYYFRAEHASPEGTGRALLVAIRLTTGAAAYPRERRRYRDIVCRIEARQVYRCVPALAPRRQFTTLSLPFVGRTMLHCSFPWCMPNRCACTLTRAKPCEEHKDRNVKRDGRPASTARARCSLRCLASAGPPQGYT